MEEFSTLYETISKIGFPALFVFGLFKEWWVMGAQYRFVIDRLADLTKLTESQASDQARTTAIVERQQGLIEAQAREIKALHVGQGTLEAKLDAISAQLATLIARGG